MRRVAMMAIVLLLIGAGSALAQEPVIRIGVNMELSGYSMEQGTQQYFGLLVSHHLQPTITVDGVTYSIELVVCDNQTLREEAEACANRLLDAGVVGVLGGFSSSMSRAAAPLLQEAGVVMISTGATNAQVTRVGDAIFRTGYTDDYQGLAIASYAYHQLGARKIVMFLQDGDAHSLDITPVIASEFARLGGSVVVHWVNPETADYVELVRDTILLNPDVLVTTAFCQIAGPIFELARIMGLNKPWIGGDSLDSAECAELAGAAFNDVLFTGFPDITQLEPDVLARATVVATTYAELFPDRPGFGGHTLASADAYSVLREAIRRSLEAGIDPADVEALRRSVHIELSNLEGFQGVSGIITYRGTDGTPANRTIGLFRVTNAEASGHFERVPLGFFTIEREGVLYHGPTE